MLEDIDLDVLAALIHGVMPWLEACAIVTPLVLGAAVLHDAIAFMRRRTSPVERLVRRRR